METLLDSNVGSMQKIIRNMSVPEQVLRLAGRQALLNIQVVLLHKVLSVSARLVTGYFISEEKINNYHHGSIIPYSALEHSTLCLLQMLINKTRV